MISNPNFNRQMIPSANIQQSGGNIPQQYGGNTSNYGHYDDQRSGQFFRNHQPASSVQHIIQGAASQNQSFNMAAQMQTFQRKNSSNSAQNYSNTSVLGYDQKLNNNNTGNKPTMVPINVARLQNDSVVPSTTMKNLVPYKESSMTNPPSNNNSLNILNLPKPKPQNSKPNISEIKGETNEQSGSRGARTAQRYGMRGKDDRAQYIFCFSCEGCDSWGNRDFAPYVLRV